MKDCWTFSSYIAACLEFIERHAQLIPRSGGAGTPVAEEEFNRLALALFGLQFGHVPDYRRFCEARGAVPGTFADWREIPALPVAAFKEFEVSSLEPAARTTVFHSSGTTGQTPSRHFHDGESLRLYEAGVRAGFRNPLLGDLDDLIADEKRGPQDKPGFIILTPSPEQAPHSSLVHMFDTVRRAFASRDSLFTGTLDQAGAWTIDKDAALFGIRKSMCANRPVVILGTAFAFVHLLDHFAEHNMRYRLAEGSRVLETGGYKGRSRLMPKAELHALITRHLGIPATHIVCEYGMSELSSQSYDHSLEPARRQDEASRCFRFTPWARSQIVSPETGRPVSEGETGLVRIFDLANARSVLAIQTEDLGIRRGDGFELIGRAALAEPRGCSLLAT